MKKLIVLFFILGIGTCLSVAHASAPVKESIRGTWKYSAPQAPYEYNSGTFIFDELAGKPSVTVRFRSGSEVKAEDVKIVGDSITFNVTVEYEPVKVAGKFMGQKFSGKANSSQGIMDLTAEKPVAKTN